MRWTMEMSNSKFTGNLCSSGIWNFFVRLYPTPSVTSPWKRVGWEFATTSVLSPYLQQAWSSKKIVKKLTDGRRFDFEGMLDLDKGEELFALFHGLFEEDAQFFAFFPDLVRGKNPTLTQVLVLNLVHSTTTPIALTTLIIQVSSSVTTVAITPLDRGPFA
jgi:hypothetical protein